MIKGFRDLDVWQKARKLTLDVYRVTNSFPRTEQFGVVSQIRRAAYSISANLAEGYGRRSTKELLQFIVVSNGSAEELRYFLMLSRDLKYLSAVDESRLEQEITGIVQMLAALSRSLRSRQEKSGYMFSRTTGHEARNTKSSQEAGA